VPVDSSPPDVGLIRRPPGAVQRETVRGRSLRHCEEHSDEAIQAFFGSRWIASLRSQ